MPEDLEILHTYFLQICYQKLLVTKIGHTQKFIGFPDDEQLVHTVTVDSFFIDAHEVPVGEYSVFVQETGYTNFAVTLQEDTYE